MKISLFIFFFFFGISLKAQSHHELWGKLNVTKEINSKWTLGMDVQHRRQTNYRTNDQKILKYPLSTFLRVWCFYKLKNNFSIFFSPFAYVQSNDIINNEGALQNTSEIRFTTGIIKKIPIGKMMNLNRFLMEHRILNIESSSILQRNRYRLQNSLTIPIKHFSENVNLKYYVFNEMFFSSLVKNNILEQDRFYNGANLCFKKLEYLIAYQYNIQNNSPKVIRNQYLIQVNVKL